VAFLFPGPDQHTSSAGSPPVAQPNWNAETVVSITRSENTRTPRSAAPTPATAVPVRTNVHENGQMIQIRDWRLADGLLFRWRTRLGFRCAPL